MSNQRRKAEQGTFSTPRQADGVINASFLYLETNSACGFSEGWRERKVNIVSVCQSGNIDYVRKYIDAGRCDELRSENGQMALIQASQNGHKNIVELLLDRGADVESRDNYGCTALMLASIEGREDIVKLLLSRGANIRARDNEGWTAFKYAIECGKASTLQPFAQFRSHGWDIPTSFVNACRDGDLEYVKRYIDAGGNVEVRNDDGEPALMVASYRGHKDIAELLLNGGADIEARDNSGATAIMYACWEGHGSVAELLLNRGANIDTRDDCGGTVRTYVLECGKASTLQTFAQFIIRNTNIPYSGFRISLLVPRDKRIPTYEYTNLVKKLVPMYIERAITNANFGISMQQDIKEILDGKTEDDRASLTGDTPAP